MTIRLNMLRKVRCRVLDKTSGKPVPRVAVSLSIGDSGNGLRLPVTTLTSDATGYLSFDLHTLTDRGLDSVGGLWVSVPQAGIEELNLLSSMSSDAEPGRQTPGSMLAYALPNAVQGAAARPLCIEFPIHVSAAKVAANDTATGCQPSTLVAVQRPDVCDYRLSPHSFVMPSKVGSSGDCCESLTLATLPVEEHGFYRVIVRRDSPDRPEFSLAFERSVRITDNLPSPRPVVKVAEVLEFRQRWFAIGHSLGEIKYSLPLAPGESTQLAVIEWSRNDLASRADLATATESLEHDIKRDRSIEETINAGLKESQGGWSWAGGLSSGMAYDAKAYGQYTGNWAAGGGTSNSWGSRTLKADSLQDLHDHINQSSSSVRSLTSTVIVQARQAEQNAVQTRRVANHNHCHALTIQYYEVLRHFRLVTEFARRRSAILVPFEPFSFSRETAIRFRSLLERVLLDSKLVDNFDALVRISLGDAAYKIDPSLDNNESEDTDDAFFTGTLTNISVDAAEPPVYARRPNKPTEVVRIQKGSTVWIRASGADIKFTSAAVESYGPDGQSGKAAPDDGVWRMPGAQSYALLAKVGSEFYEVGYDTAFVAKNAGWLSFWYNDKNRSDNKGKAIIDELTVARPVRVTDEEESGDAKTATTNHKPTKDDDLVKAEFLIKHLDGNAGYYDRAIWFLMDPTERRLYLEAALGGDSDLLAVIDDKPIAISGSHLAFYYNAPVAPEAEPEPDPEPVESIVTLPTRGLFAEAQLGHCNSCEKRDVTRMWDWTEMTAEEPPMISGIEPGPKGEIPNLSPTQLPANVIQITQPPSAPDPTGLANALAVLKTPDIFRDMSGLNEASALLGKLADGTIRTLEGMLKTAGQAKEKVDAARANQSAPAASGTGSSGSSAPSAADLANRLSLLPEIKTFAKDLGLTDEQMRQFALDQIYGTNPNTRNSTNPTSTTAQQVMQLSDPSEAERWEDLIKFVPPAAIMNEIVTRNLGLQRIEDGRSELNLDWYPVHIRQLPNKPGTVVRFTAAEFFDYVREKFTGLLEVYPRTFKAESLEPYTAGDGTLWATPNPLRSVMQFNIDLNPLPLMIDSMPNGIPTERGLVICAEYVSDAAAMDFHWNFCTVNAYQPIGWHPVSGTRQFGLGMTQDGLTFYVRGADRPTTFMESAAGRLLIWGQEEYWEKFRSNLVLEITRLAGVAELGERVSRRYDWAQVRAQLYGGGITA